MSLPRTAALSLLALPCVLVVTACGDASVSAGDVESQIKTQIGKLGTAPIKDVSCPEDLVAKVGKSEKCTLTYASGNKLEITATVDKVTDDKANFKMVVTKELN